MSHGRDRASKSRTRVCGCPSCGSNRAYWNELQLKENNKVDIVDQINSETAEAARHAKNREEVNVMEYEAKESFFHSPVPALENIYNGAVIWYKGTKHKSGVNVLAAILLGFILLSIVGGTSYALGRSCDGYKIERGDSLTKIARDNGTSVTELASLNGIINPDKINAGNCLTLPASTTSALEKIGPDNPSRYAVIEEPEVVPETVRELYYRKANEYNSGPGYDTDEVLYYLRAKQDLGFTRPGSFALAVGLQEAYPLAGFAVDETYGIGAYAGRNARGSNSLSTHAEGRSVDFYYPGCNDAGYAIYNKLVSNARNLGLVRVAYCDLDWQAGWNGPTNASPAVAKMHNGTTGPVHFHMTLSENSAKSLILDQVQVVFPATAGVTL